MNTIITLLVIALLASTDSATELCVVPYSHSACPCPTSTCHVFDYYLNNSQQYFVSDTTFLFLEGTHTVHGAYDGSNVSGLNFTGQNATLFVSPAGTVSGSWFSLINSTSLSFSGLSLTTNSSYSELISLTNISSLEMTDIQIKSTCTGGVVVGQSSGAFIIRNVNFNSVYRDTAMCSRSMVAFFNSVGEIDISRSKFSYCGIQLALIAIDIALVKLSNTTIRITNTETYRAGIGVAYLNAPTVNSSAHLDILVDKVFISGPYYVGLGLNILVFVGICNMTILNTKIERVNGTALTLGLNNGYPSNTLISNTQISYSYGTEHYGVAMSVIGVASEPPMLHMDNVTFESNTYPGTVTVLMAYVRAHMENCAFRNNRGTALFMEGSHLTPLGYNEFVDNSAFQGAGLSLGEDSTLYVGNNTLLNFTNNEADGTAGAIQLRTDPASYIKLLLAYTHASCFIASTEVNWPSNTVFYFDNNTANSGGDVIFGGNLDFKSNNLLSLYYCIDEVDRLSVFAQESVSLVSSPPSRVCLCGEDGRPQCLLYQTTLSVYPGQTFNISAFTVGQQFGTVRGSVYAQIFNKNSNTSIPINYRVQTVGIRNCTGSDNTLTYKLATSASETLVLTTNDVVVSEYVDKSIIDALISEYRDNLKKNLTHVPRQLITLPLFITLRTLECPRGFALTDSGCGCASVLRNHFDKYSVSCDIDTQTISRQYSVWVDATNTSTSYSKNCPLLYCNSSLLEVDLSSDRGSDVQCVQHHSGVLCGGCRVNHSLAIGSSNCLPNCSDSYLSLLGLFAVAGVLLVLLVKYLNLTVTQGLLNGFILYANIVQNKQICSAIIGRNGRESSLCSHCLVQSGLWN